MRILVIEDEARIQAFLARGLEAEGYTVVAAGDGREGLDLATGARWDLVVLDLLLPRAQRAPGPAGAEPRQARAAGRDPLGAR